MCIPGRPSITKLAVTAILWALVPQMGLGLQPPDPQEIKQLASEGKLAERLQAARELGNHKTDPLLVWTTRQKLMMAAGIINPEVDDVIAAAPPSYWGGGLPASGTPKVLVLLVDFPDYPHYTNQTQADVYSKFFGSGDSDQAPYESLRNFYQRSSYNQLTIQGDVLGWYTAQNDRQYYEDLGPGLGRETLIKEALETFNAQGHDFSQYDNDGNGTIDSLFIKWTGPDTGWAGFWWAYQASWYADTSYRIDGKAMGKYVWSWISNPEGGLYQPKVDIHETGHLLGLPDLYDYSSSVGPKGGVGGLDMMDSNWGDHNCFSKFMLGWLTPTTVSSGSQILSLNPSGTSQDCVLIMPGITPGTIFAEFFMAQYRKRSTGNDPYGYPTDGCLIWHIDSRLNASGTNFLYDNSYAAHKLVRLMEADGLEEIEQGLSVDSGDFYLAPAFLGPHTSPDSRNYAGTATNIQVDQLSSAGTSMSGRFSILTRPIIGAAEATLDTESSTPANGAVDPGEVVTMTFYLKNTGAGDTTNLVATLQPSGAISGVCPDVSQTYGVLTAGGSPVGRQFRFAADGDCGGTITITLSIKDGSETFPPVSFTVRLGAVDDPLSQDFDSAVAPALPAGWSATVAQGSFPPWATATLHADTPPNAAFASDPDGISDNRLDSPIANVILPSSQLVFRHRYDLETGYDGGVLEISIAGEPFTDIITAGGSFADGGYTHTLANGFGNPLSGRQAWSGSSDGFITTVVYLPLNAVGQNIRLRWRLGSDSGYGDTGWYVDSVDIPGGFTCSPTVRGDFDHDGDVDGFDFLTFANCYNGSDKPPLPACLSPATDLEMDCDVDGFDFLTFANCYNGSDRPPLCP
jgi:M6 family metalloprotease-like protein